MRWNRVVAIAAVVVLAAATPAGAGSGGDAAPTSVAEQWVDLVREAWNEDPGLAALRAQDKGYDLEQTFEALTGDELRLAADGTITEEGRPVAPAGAPTAVLAREGEAKVVAALDETEAALAKEKSIDPPKELVDDGTLMLVVLLGLLADGYSLEQVIVDGLLADGVTPGGFGTFAILDEKGRPIQPDNKPVEDMVAENIITDVVAIVQGYDPQDPPYKPRYDVTYDGQLASKSVTADVTAKGTLGTDPSGSKYFGRLKGKMEIPADEKCAAETVLVVITLRGDVPPSGQAADLNQAWSYRGSTGGGGEGLCITAGEASGLVEFIPGLFGSFSGVVKPGAKLKSFLGNATLSIGAKG